MMLPRVMASDGTMTPRITAPAGLMQVMNVVREGPTWAMCRWWRLRVHSARCWPCPNSRRVRWPVSSRRFRG